MQSESAKLGGDGYIGTTVAGRFSVSERIGAGGMGTVYRAEQTPLGRPVALKLLKEEVAWDAETVTRFHREAKAMSLLQSPHTVRVFDFGQTENGILFLAMELLEGETLSQRLKRVGALDPVLAIRVIQQVLDSLNEAHSKGIIHRDLKPDNIVLADTDEEGGFIVKVLDFGIAKVFEGDNDFDSLETQAGTVFGTPRYMSPEQAQGKKLDARSDLYSVGVLLYQLVTGVPPFQDDDAVVVMAQHIRDHAPSPMELAPTRPITERLNKTVMRAIAKQPEKRWQTAVLFTEALEKCVQGLVDYSPRQTGIFGRVMPSSRRPLWIAALVLIGSGLIAGYIVWSAGQPLEDVPETYLSPVVPPDRQASASTMRTAAADAPEVMATTLRSTPSGAEAWAEEELLGVTPLTLDLDDGALQAIELRLDGHESQAVLLLPGLDQDVELRRIRRRIRNDRDPSEDTTPRETTMQSDEAPTMRDYERLEF